MGDVIRDHADTTFEAFAAKVVAAHEGLPPKLRKIAGFVLDHPERAALMTIADLSAEVGVQPSAVIRFSKALGYAGFSDIQKILRQQLEELIPTSYKARLEAQEAATGAARGQMGRVTALAEASLEALPAEADIHRAAQSMAAARMIHIVGMRRAFGIASYAAYLLAGFGAPVHQFTATGAMSEGGTQMIGQGDVVLGISFPNFRSETLDVVEAAHQASAHVIALTNSAVSPIAKDADQVLIADAHDDAGFRSTVGSMVTVQALAMEYGRLKG